MARPQISNSSVFFWVSVAIGCVLRLLWPLDMEWKADEKAFYALATQFPSVGILNSQGVPNAAMSNWILASLRFVAESPVGLVTLIQGMNATALLGFIWLCFRFAQPSLRKSYLWGMQLFAVSPLPIIYSRKIWQQSLIPFFTFLMAYGVVHRRKFWGGFSFGILGMVICQIHQAGFFFFPIFLLFLYLLDRKEKKNVPWVFSVSTGILIGALGLVPWVLHCLSHPIGRKSAGTYFSNVVSLKFLNALS